MFIIKQTINSSTSLYEIKAVTIARPGSEAFKQAFEMADELDTDTPDMIEHIPVVYADQDMKKPIGEEHKLSVVRSGVQRKDCIAVVCSSEGSELFPELTECGGIGYQFLYKGDELFVMGPSGRELEEVY